MKKVFLFISLIVLSPRLNASHILGSQISYKVTKIENNKASVSLVISFLLDENEGHIDDSLVLGIYNNIDMIYKVYSINSLKLIDRTLLFEHATGECGDIEFKKVTKFTYEGNVKLDNNSDFYIAFQRCCFEEHIGNLVSPDKIGLATTLQLNKASLQTVHDGPKSKNLFQKMLEKGQMNSIDFSSSSEQELMYQLSATLNGGELGSEPGSCCYLSLPDPTCCLPPYRFNDFESGFSYSTPLGNDFPFTFVNGVFSFEVKDDKAYNLSISITEKKESKVWSISSLNWTFLTKAENKYSNGKLFIDKNNNGVLDIGETLQKIDFGSVQENCGIQNVDDSNYFFFPNNIDKYDLVSLDTNYYISPNTNKLDFTNADIITADIAFIKKPRFITKLNIGPVPTMDFVYIDIILPDEESLVKIELYNTIGQKMFSSTTAPQILDFRNYSNGHYVLKLFTSKGRHFLRRLMKM